MLPKTPSTQQGPIDQEKSPVIEAPEDKKRKLIHMLRENEVSWTRLKLDEYKPADQKEVMGTRFAIMADLLEELLTTGKLSAWDFAYKLEKKYRYYSPQAFNACCSAIVESLKDKT